MPGPFYLTPELKKYYLLDFEQVLLIMDPFWGIPEGFLRGILKSINTSENIQSLYSKLKHQTDSEDEESYLVIAYSKNIEAELQQKLKKLQSSFVNQTLSIDILTPSDNLNIGPADYQIGAIHKKDYFKIHHIRITFISDIYDDHLIFWTSIKDLLVKF